MPDDPRAVFERTLAAGSSEEPDAPPHPAETANGPGVGRPSRPLSRFSDRKAGQPGQTDGGLGGRVATWGTGDKLLVATHPPLVWHLEPVIPEGFTLFAGAPKVGKSWFVQELDMAAAAGGTFLGERVTARPVLQLALEDSDRRLQARARVLGRGISVAHLYGAWHYVTATSGEDISTLILRWAEQLPDKALPPLITLDTWGRAKGPRPMSMSPYDHDYAVGVALKTTVDSLPGAALVVVHHDRKADATDFVDSLSGTHGIAGSADTVVVVRRDRVKSDGVLLVTGRDVTESAYAVTFNGGRWEKPGTWEESRDRSIEIAATVGRGDTATMIVALLARAPEGMKLADIAERVDVSSDAARKALQRLRDAGHVNQVRHGVYALPALDLGGPDRDRRTDDR